jgi:alpha-tubulin suppressor-like RCC1 family protein
MTGTRRIGLALTVASAVTCSLGCGGSDPEPLPLLTGVSAITAGGSHACVLLGDGTARCWGDEVFGELGNDTLAAAVPNVAHPVTVDLAGIVQLTAGGLHTCALLNDTTVACWGDDGEGQLGNGVRSLATLTPSAVAALTNVTSVVAMGPSVMGSDLSYEYTCALLAGGTAQCWGNDSASELGDGMVQTFVATPVPVSGLTGAVALTLGGMHACAVLSDRTVSCWGNYDLIHGSTTPAPVTGLAGVVAIAAGELHTCALLNDGTVSCWGDDLYGQLGNGATSSEPATAPESIAQLESVTAIAAGADHTCALLADGTVRCWGFNSDGQVGSDLAISILTTPTIVSGLAGVVAITAGGEFTCALITGGTVKCWGQNASGQLGNGSSSMVGVSTPVSVTSGS